MENYNFTPENIDDVNIQKTAFYEIFLEECSNLLDLGVLVKDNIDNSYKEFWTKFIKNHLEIRSEIRLTRHFILKKNDKLAKELKTSLFMKDIYSDLMDQSKREYWKFVHTVFLIFETVHKEKEVEMFSG